MKQFVIVFLLAQALSLADTVQLVSAGNINDGNYYVGDVILDINGVPITALCIDFNDRTNVGDTWTASIVPMLGAQANPLVQSYYPGITAVQLTDAAWLFQQMQQNLANHTTVINIQHAEWDLMSNANLPDGGWEAQAISNGSTTNLAPYYMVLDTEDGRCREQAYMYGSSTVPEPAVTLSLGGGLILISWLARRRRLNAERQILGQRQRAI
jgi:hypothetical protein